jgi:hypothetical protein
MLILAMTAFSPCKIPTIFLNKSYQFNYFHTYCKSTTLKITRFAIDTKIEFLHKPVLFTHLQFPKNHTSDLQTIGHRDALSACGGPAMHRACRDVEPCQRDNIIADCLTFRPSTFRPSDFPTFRPSTFRPSTF